MRQISSQSLAVVAAVPVLALAGFFAAGFASGSDGDVTRAARRYRLQVFQSFHTNRYEYDRRIAVGNRILEQWRSRGAPAGERAEIIDWFQKATDVSRSGAIQRLPEYSSSSSKQIAPERLPRIQQPPQPRRQPRTVRSDSNRRRRFQDPVVGPEAPSLDRQAQVDSTIPRPGRESAPPKVLPSAPSPADPVPPVASNDIVGILPRSPAPRADAPLIRARRVRRPDQELPEPETPLLAQPSRVGDPRVPSPSHDAGTSELGVIPQLDPNGFIRSEIDVPDVVANRITVPVPPATIESQSDVREDTYALESQVDLSVLAARIRSSNLRLSEIESELAENGLWDADRLSPLVDRFDRMLSGRQLSRLYYGALDDSERERVAEFSPIRPTMTLLTQRLFEARVAAAEDPVFVPPDSQEVDKLQDLVNTIQSWKQAIPENEH